jgi:hypothetical protein
MDDSKIKELQTLHRELAQYLTNQNEATLSLKRVVAGIQQTLENDSDQLGGRSALANRYKAYLATQVPTETPRSNLTERLSREAVELLAKRLNEW